MREAVGYKITNKVNGLTYYGIIYKDLNIARRFEEHMRGKGGSILYKQGVLIYGRESFIIEEICRGNLTSVREWEYNQNINNLWPSGYNGNAGKLIIITEEAKQRRNKSFRNYLNKRTDNDIHIQNNKRAETRSKRSAEELQITSKKLSAAGKKFWNNLTIEEKREFLNNRGKAKSKSYQSQTEDYKQNIRNKIKKTMCKKRYKTPSGIFCSTVDGGKAEGISPALFNHRCKSKHWPEWEILSP